MAIELLELKQLGKDDQSNLHARGLAATFTRADPTTTFRIAPEQAAQASRKAERIQLPIMPPAAAD